MSLNTIDPLGGSYFVEKDRIVIGVNEQVERDEQALETLLVDPALERQQIDRLRSVKAKRDSTEVERLLTQLKEDAAMPERKLMPTLLDATRAHASEREIIIALQEVFGTFRETPVY